MNDQLLLHNTRQLYGPTSC